MSILISPNMSLPIPGVGTEAGPDYALDVNSCLTLLDSHDHSAGNGVQITPAGLDINATLDIQSNQLTNILSASFTAQTTPSAVLQSLSVAPGTEPTPIQDLWFTDGVGNQVQITANGLVNATIASLPGQSYSAGTFFWKQGTGSTVPANFDIGSIVIRPNIAATTYGVTLSPPSAISSAYTLQLPEDPSGAGGSNFLVISTSGIISGGALVDNSSIEFVGHVLRVKAGGITPAMLSTSATPVTRIQTFLAGGSFVVPAGVTWIEAIVCAGGGGGGGGGYNSGPGTGGGGGGGGGAGQVMQVLPVTGGETLTIVIGTGGTGSAGSASGNGNTGGTGTNSTISRGATILSLAQGGVGGNGGLPGPTPTGGPGGIPGSSIYYGPAGGAGGNASLPGNAPPIGSFYGIGNLSLGGSAQVGKGGGGGGGSGYLAPGGNGGNATAGGTSTGANAAANTGGGGGGGGSGSATSAGGNGGSGRVIIMWVSVP